SRTFRPAEGALHPRASPTRALRPGDRRASLRAALLGRLAADSGDAWLDLSPARRSALRHQCDEARISAISRGRRRAASDRAPEGAFSGELLAADSPLLGRTPSRSVHDGGTHRAGVDLRGRRAIVGERVRIDANRPRDGLALRASAAAVTLLDPDAPDS